MISVIIPIYNIESLLPRCIDSLLSQSYLDFELILVDDGSTDRSGLIIDEYALKDERIVAVHQENAGVSAARNCGLDRAAGEWITFVDSDDYVTETYLEDLYTAAIASDADLVVSGCKYVMNGIPRSRKFDNEIVSADDCLSIFRKHELGRSCCVWGRLYRTEMVGALRFPVGAVNAEDIIFTCNYLLNIKTICFTDKINYNYEVRAGSLTKVIYPFENEVIALNKLYEARLKLSARYQGKDLSRFIRTRDLFERTVQSLYSGRYNRKERLTRLNSLRFDYSDIVLNDANLREQLYCWLIKFRMWQLFDFMNIRMFKNADIKYVER